MYPQQQLVLEMEVACFGTSWPRGCNCLFGQLRTQLQLNHKIRRKPLSWVAHSQFPPVPWQGWRVGLCWAGWAWGKGTAALVSTLGMALSFYVRGPKTRGVPGGERETASEIDCKISNVWTILPPPEMCLKPSSFLPPTQIRLNSHSPAPKSTSPILISPSIPICMGFLGPPPHGGVHG